MIAKVAGLLAVAGMASAFVPAAPLQGASVARQSSALQMGFENALGAQPPLGFFDPIGLLKDADQDTFDRLRAVELKHGRIAMLAVVGHITQQNYRFPGYLSFRQELTFADMPNGLAGLAKVPAAGIMQIVIFIGILEAYVWKQKDSGIPGDFGIDWVVDFTEEQKMRKRAIELNNGRAAQMGILGLMVHEKLNGHPYVINEIFGQSITVQ
mmetsp:Transcript_3890/g.5785  ORF Transcript_3890/g.5785 Transcript_3890/m.5785 type:complete len:211 (-) Transcript_3890:217-849(-)|eukprot:CAMPEP_0113935932 /NCGR_PEP_ID=MMETSP1339-20121228/2947_1 /TAXON_ID=94617 /ORGANISM="Fibrocapsa japonica" /LENGTH=210 /DNA_ID=CAMNT_0000938235 /DNA_START=179 /DNA_END=811 /DNA_ORIENTATION=+ /assembly_acc=CAM_ASM_000762